MGRQLLDTDILSEIIKGKNVVVAARAGVYLAEHGRLTTSAVSIAEIVYGFRRMGRQDRVAQLRRPSARLVKLELDANLGTRGIELLRRRGHDVATAEDQRLGRAPDRELIAACAQEGRALVTLDKDFANPLRYPPSNHAGVVVLRMPVRFTPAEVEGDIDAWLLAVGRTAMRGRLRGRQAA